MTDTDAGRVPLAPGSQATPSAAHASSPVGADPSRGGLGAYVGLTSASNSKYPDAAEVSGGSFTFLPINTPINLEELEARSDAALIEHAVRIARPRYRSRAPRWVAVMDVFALGRTSAISLCERFGFDPEEVRVRR